jgi:outer membrane lipoprotein-sorting protein
LSRSVLTLISTTGLFCAAAIAVLLPRTAAVEEDPRALLAEIVKESAKITSIDAQIEQYISAPGTGNEYYKGRYRSDSQGRMRIDYTVPSAQVVIHDGRSFYWYYPEDKLLYKIERRGMERPAAGPDPLRDVAKDLESKFTVEYLGTHLHGFFTPAHYFLLKNTENGVTLDVLVDKGKKVVLLKTVRDARGTELVRESYDGYAQVGDAWFPSRVTVAARTAGGLTKNITVYTDVALNRGVPASLFIIDVPRDVIAKTISE